MARPRSQDFDDQRKFILKHAAALFAQRGYVGTSMKEVAEACGLSKPTVYHYFKDKEDLLLSIADNHLSTLVELVRGVAEQGSLTGEERLRNLILCFLDAYQHAQCEHRVLTEDVRFLPEEQRLRVIEKERAVVRAFTSAVVEARPELADSGLQGALTMLLFGMINWMFTWFKPGDPLTHRSIAPVVVQLFLGGIQRIAEQPELAVQQQEVAITS